MLKPEFVDELLRISYGRSDVKAINVFHGNAKRIFQMLKPGRHIFVGQLRIDFVMFCEKNPAFLAPSTCANLTDLYTFLAGQAQELVATPLLPTGNGAVGVYTTTNAVLEYNNVVFDDLAFCYTNLSTQNKLAGDIQAGFSSNNGLSLSSLCSGGNAAFTTLWAPILATNPSFMYAPQYLSFMGYIVNVGN